MYADGWDSIPVEGPDPIGLEMVRDAQNDPDCREFVPQEELEAILA